MKTGRLVGIVSGYERPYPSGRGVYVSLQAIHQFLYNYARPTPRIIEQRFRQPRVLEQRWSCPT